MKRLLIIGIILFPFTVFAQINLNTFPRKIINIDKNWKFHEGRLSNGQAPDFNHASWQTVNVPHDWRIHEPYNKNNRRLSGYLPKGIGWYRKVLDIKPQYKGSRIFISFDGVFRNYTVWINGKEVGWHLSGYTGCVLDITKLVDFNSQKNILTVLVDNVDSNKLVKPHPQSEYGAGHEGWWYEGYGIYRHVNLIITNPVHVSTWGTFIYTNHDSHKSAEVNIKVNVSNQTDHSHHLVVKNLVFDPAGKRVNVVSDKYDIGANSKIDLHQKTLVLNPKLWSPDHPNLYNVITEVFSDGVLTDRYKTPIGIRWFRFTADSGFFLNGQHLQLRGMNIHAGFGGLGTALPDAANDYDVLLAKQMGCNIIRSAHNDPSPSLMEACDKLGMLLWAETRYLGADTFALATLHDMIQRDRNHPSIICWSLANNSGRNNVKLTYMLKVMNTLAKKMDPTRPTAFGCEANGNPNWTGFACVTDIMGYNGGGMGRDDKDHKDYPDRKMLISEYSSGMGVRGNYKDRLVGEHKFDTLGDGRIFPLDATLFSQYDLCSSHEEEWSHIAKRPWLAGGMMWSGFEYIGESDGWPVVTSQFGVFDIARFKKDAYYYYLQEWTKKPMVHIFPDWTWDKRDSVIDVWCYSNCDKVELFLNGKSLGTKAKVPLSHIEWKVPYEPGTLEAKGYDDGKLIAQTEIRTAGKPYQLTAKADRSVIKANGTDLSFITIKVCDKNGTLIPHADNLINVKVTGGKLLGLCSGNPAAHVDPASTWMKAFNGKLLAIIQSYDHQGKIVLKVSSENLQPGTVIVKAE